LVRIEDLDLPRAVAGADKDILHTLEALGLHWDGVIVYQSQRCDAYEAALHILREEAWLYACNCTRAELQSTPVYPGTCRAAAIDNRRRHSLRIRVPEAAIEFADLVQGTVRQRLTNDVGDFIVRRSDGLFAYHLAIVIDDAWQGVTEVLRGADLLDSTPRQIFLQRTLRLPVPVYLHIPVAVDSRGRKLSKQNRAPAVNAKAPVKLWMSALQYLGQNPPAKLGDAALEDIKGWALDNWTWQRIPTIAEQPAPADN
jgi:glutamyl-Q tRNA(Asp) synthetase